jgi:hypothetical protein
MFLALATAEYPSSRGPDGTQAPEIDNRLVYVFRATDVPCLRSGGPPGAGGGRGGQPIPSPPVPQAPDRCLVIGLMDATHGNWIVHMQTNQTAD